MSAVGAVRKVFLEDNRENRFSMEQRQKGDKIREMTILPSQEETSAPFLARPNYEASLLCVCAHICILPSFSHCSLELHQSSSNPWGCFALLSLVFVHGGVLQRQKETPTRSSMDVPAHMGAIQTHM